ncbi:hypothetical protein D9M68_350680 [compost metagenome]
MERGLRHISVLAQRAVQRDRRVNALHLQLVERTPHAGQGTGAVGVVHDELAEQRVVVRRHGVAGKQEGVEAHARAARHHELRHEAGARHEVLRRVLGVDAHLDGRAVQADVVLLQAQRLAERDAQHFLHEVDAGDHLGDRVLDLDARVHLDEEELARVVVVQVFERARAAVGHGAREPQGRFAQRGARGLADGGRGRFFPHLLAPALQRTFALEAVHHALAVAQDLHLDVARLADEAFEVHLAVAESGLRFGGGGGELLAQLGFVVRHADAAPAAAGRGLDHDRVADVLRDFDGGVGVGHHARAAGHGGHAGAQGGGTRRGLVAHGADRMRRGAHEHQARGLDALGERGVLRKKTVARMHRAGAAVGGGLQDRVDAQVALGGVRRADAHGLVSHAHGDALRVGVAVDGDGLQP